MADVKERYIPRLLKLYQDEIIPKMKEKFGYTNNLAVPRLVKIAINMGLGAAATDLKIGEKAQEELAKLSGQKAKVCRARKPISNFKLKKGALIGCCVILRRYRMYEFLDRLITVAFPRIRDFRGLSVASFDGSGNYTFGLLEQSIFPEIDIDRISRTQGMNVTIHTSSLGDEQARELITLMGFPFRKQQHG